MIDYILLYTIHTHNDETIGDADQRERAFKKLCASQMTPISGQETAYRFRSEHLAGQIMDQLKRAARTNGYPLRERDKLYIGQIDPANAVHD